MRYLLLSYTPAQTWDAGTAEAPSPEALAAFAEYQRIEAELRETGEFVTSEGLGHPAVSTTVRPVEGQVVATDGPFAELKEVLASFAIVDCQSQERAVDIAARVVSALGEPVEVRPIMGEEFAGEG